MLKEFRSIDVYWDKATRRIYEEIRSSSSDEKGRKLTVQIVNDGQIQDLTNVALNLYWETQDGENRGLDPFEPLDPENGIYELYFRTGMLKHVGKLNAHLHLVDTTGAITSEPFTIFVFEGVDVDAMASDDELSALNQALIEVQNIKQDEAERVSAEAERATAEEERVSNENERKNAETIRLTNETDRVDNEEDRVAAESDRVSAESSRTVNENARLSAESDRVTAENVRAEGYPLLDGRLTTVEQNIDLLHQKTKGLSLYADVTTGVAIFPAETLGVSDIHNFVWNANMGYNDPLTVLVGIQLGVDRLLLYVRDTKGGLPPDKQYRFEITYHNLTI